MSNFKFAATAIIITLLSELTLYAVYWLIITQVIN